MEISIPRDSLVKPLGQVAGVVERRQTLPILAYVLIRLNGDRLTMLGTDLEVEVLAGTDSVNGEAGEITMPARKLLDICRSLPGDATVKIAQKGEKAVVSSGRSRFTLVTMPATDFPGVETTEWNQEFEIPQGMLKSVLEATQFCMAHQDVRYYLNGLLLEVEGRKLRAVATDGHRMGMKEVELSEAVTEARQVIVPRKGVLELSRFLEESDTPAKVSLGSNHIRVTLPDLTFTSKLIDGRFPDYTKVIPQDQSKKILVERQTFRDALSRAAILSNEKYRGVRLTLEKDALRITAHNPEQEEAEEEVSIDYAGDALEIGFNVNYLIEAMGTLASEQVQLGLSDPSSSCALMTPGDENTLYVIMPMRL